MNNIIDRHACGSLSGLRACQESKVQRHKIIPFVSSRPATQPVFRHSATACCAMSPEQVREELEGESLEKWNACVEKVGNLGLEADKAEVAVGQAFGWGKQSYWLDKKKQEVPKPEQVESVLGYLEGELGLSKEDVSKVVKKFPEVMNLNVDRRLKANIEHMQKAKKR